MNTNSMSWHPLGQCSECVCFGSATANLLEFPVAMQAFAMCPTSGFKVHFYIYCSSGHFAFIPFCLVLYSIYMRTCIIVTYPFASATLRDNRKYYFLPFLDHTTSISTKSASKKWINDLQASMAVCMDGFDNRVPTSWHQKDG